MTRYWLCVTIPHNWEIVKRLNVWGVDDRYRITLERHVSLEDKFIFYVTGRGASGAYQVASPYFYSKKPLGWINKRGKPYLYPNRVKIEPILLPKKILPFSTALRRELIFITDKSGSWAPFVYPSMVIIPKEDYQTLIGKMADLI